MVSVLAATCAAAFAWAVVRRSMGRAIGPSSLLAHRSTSWGLTAGKHREANFQVWLSQAGAAVTPRQFCAVSAGVGLIVFTLLMALSRTFVVSVLPACASTGVPYGYWSSQRRRQAVERSAAWPDALRYLVGVLGAGIATLHDALADLAQSGPMPLRAPMARYVRLSGRLGDRQALEVVRSELADAISDPVLLAFGGAIEEGTETVLRVLSDVGAQITADLQLAEKIRTLQTQSRVATWGCFSLPYVVLLLLCTTNPNYRSFFSAPLGVVLLIIGASLSTLGLVVSQRLVRPMPTTGRVFVDGGELWAR
jgi:tight adherence protein B